MAFACEIIEVNRVRIHCSRKRFLLVRDWSIVDSALAVSCGSAVLHSSVSSFLDTHSTMGLSIPDCERKLLKSDKPCAGREILLKKKKRILKRMKNECYRIFQSWFLLINFFKYLIGQLYIKVETLKSIPEFF